MLMEDESRGHTARLKQGEYRWHNIVKMWFPAISPDLNPIENGWKKLKDAICRQQPRTPQELEVLI
jgi:transposase